MFWNWGLLLLYTQSFLRIKFIYLTILILRRLSYSFELFQWFLVGLRPHIVGFKSFVFCFRISLIVDLWLDVCEPSLPNLYLHFLLRLSLWVSPFLLLILIRVLRLVLSVHLGIRLLLIPPNSIAFKNCLLVIFCSAKWLTSRISITIGPIILSTSSSKFVKVTVLIIRFR